MGDEEKIPTHVWRDLMIAAHSIGGDEPGGAAMPMNDEDMKFVERAISEAAHKANPARVMKIYMDVLRSFQNPTAENEDEAKRVADGLQDMACYVNCSVDFCNKGGLVEIQRILKCDCDEVRAEVMRIIPTIAQNRPEAQDLIVRTDLLQDLMAIIADPKEKPIIRIRALSAVSAIIRAHSDAFGQFLRFNGFVMLVDVFNASHSTGEDQVANKIALTVTSVANDLGYNSALDHGVPTIIVRMLGSLPHTHSSASYMRDYIQENLPLEKIDSECKQILTKALNEAFHAENDNKDAVDQIKKMLSRMGV